MNKKGFTLVELLAVIAILAILVIIALPNVIKLYNNAKKNAFMTEAQNLAKEVSSKYISESMKGNKVTVISNKQNPFDMTGSELEYNFELDSQGKIKNMIVSNGTYCISTNKDYTKITRDDISDKCSYEKLHNIAGTLKNKFYEESGRTDRSLVSSVVFYSDGRTIDGSESYDVSEEKDGSVKMYVTQNNENSSLVDLTIVANGKIAFPEHSSYLFLFYKRVGCSPAVSNLSRIEFNNSIDTSNVIDMSYMFKNIEFPVLDSTALDLSSFDTSNVTDMSGMFQYSNATALNLNSFNTSKVTSMRNMFYNSKATTLDLSSFDTSKVTDMSWMFSRSAATEIKGLDKFNTSNVSDMSGMFYISNATALNLSSFDTSKVTSMRSMFGDSEATTLDLSSFDTRNVVGMGGMFSGSEATEIKGLNKFDTSKVTDMSIMFNDSKATALDLSSFDTSKVTYMHRMFAWSAATEIVGLNKFNTSKVTNMNDMFCESQATTLDLSSFDTSKVTDMGGMFQYSNATALDLSSFDTSKVRDMSVMFFGCAATIGYAKDAQTAAKFNDSSVTNIPDTLKFTVK